MTLDDEFEKHVESFGERIINWLTEFLGDKSFVWEKDQLNLYED
jgi:hypothetical protein